MEIRNWLAVNEYSISSSEIVQSIVTLFLDQLSVIRGDRAIQNLDRVLRQTTDRDPLAAKENNRRGLLFRKRDS